MCIGGMSALLTALVWAAPPDQLTKDLTQKRKDLTKVKKELSLTKGKEKEIRGKESSILENLYALDSELRKKEKELKEMEPQLTKTKEKIQQTGNQIFMLNKGIEQTREELFSRINALYRMQRISPGTFLLASQSYLDLLRMDKYLRTVIDYDHELILTHLSQVALKEKYHHELIQDQRQWQRAISDVQKKREEIKGVREEKQALLKSIQKEKAVYQRLIEELEGRAKELQTLVEKLEKEKSVVAYGKPRADLLKAKLSPPVQGKIISSFKEKGQNGIEIKAPMGAEVRAVLPGKVLYADWFKGFGNIVIIDHGDHLFTVSGYSSQLLKKTGDTVSQGETIALVGSAGSLKGPCLYFEIRHRGKPQDPMEWIQMEKVVSLPEGNEKAKKEL